MLIHVPRDVGHVKIRVGLVGELLELGVERFLSEVSSVQGHQEKVILRERS